MLTITLDLSEQKVDAIRRVLNKFTAHPRFHEFLSDVMKHPFISMAAATEPAKGSRPRSKKRAAKKP